MKVQKIIGLFWIQSLHYVDPFVIFFQLLYNAVITRGQYQNHIGFLWVFIYNIKEPLITALFFLPLDKNIFA